MFTYFNVVVGILDCGSEGRVFESHRIYMIFLIKVFKAGTRAWGWRVSITAYQSASLGLGPELSRQTKFRACAWHLFSLFKSHHFTKIFWKIIALSLTFPFWPKSMKKLFSANCSPMSKKTFLSKPFQSSRTQHRDRFVTYCKQYFLRSEQWQHFCSSFVGAFCSFWHYWPFSSPLPPVFGIQSECMAIRWFHLYLSDRYDSTSVNNSSSSPSQFMHGVPQGYWGQFSSSCTLHFFPIS